MSIQQQRYCFPCLCTLLFCCLFCDVSLLWLYLKGLYQIAVSFGAGRRIWIFRKIAHLKRNVWQIWKDNIVWMLKLLLQWKNPALEHKMVLFYTTAEHSIQRASSGFSLSWIEKYFTWKRPTRAFSRVQGKGGVDGGRRGRGVFQRHKYELVA